MSRSEWMQKNPERYGEPPFTRGRMTEARQEQRTGYGGRIMMATRNTPTLWTQSLARLRSGLLITAQAAGLILLFGIGYFYLLIIAALMHPEEVSMPAAEYRYQWTESGRYIEHQNTHDGRGFVPIE